MSAETASPPSPDGSYQGVGFGLRWDFLDELMAALGDGTFEDVPFFEVSPENYMRRGGYIPESLEYIAERIPIITHGLMMSLGGLDPFDTRYFDELRRFVHRFRSPWHSDHLCFSGVDRRILHDLLPMPQTRDAALYVAGRVREARARLEIPVGIENISFYAHLGEPELEETEFIGTILDAADCGLLLDVNNVFVNSQNHGFDPRAWLERIDVGRVMQIHIAGHEYRDDDGLIIDTHGATVIDPVYELLTATVARTGPVAVILERDNDVPPLAEMLAEWRRVEAAYQRGIAAWQQQEGPPTREQTPARELEPQPPLARIDAAQHVIDHAVRAHDVEAIAVGLREGHPTLDPRDAETLRATDPRRIRVYRNLVRQNLFDAIRNQLPRTHARMGDEAYARYVGLFCERELPRSQILRDVAFEFAVWASPQLDDDRAVPDYLSDLARYELLEFDVHAAEDITVALSADELVADAPVAFVSTARLGAFEHAVHQLPEDPADTTLPERRATGVFAYRDRAGDYRELDLTPLATAILGRLLGGTETFAEAVLNACAARAVSVDQQVIDGTSQVLADLAERGAVLGATAEPPPAPSPYARWLMGPSFVAF